MFQKDDFCSTTDDAIKEVLQQTFQKEENCFYDVFKTKYTPHRDLEDLAPQLRITTEGRLS